LLRADIVDFSCLSVGCGNPSRFIFIQGVNMPQKNPNTGPDGVTRRGFLTSMGAGAIGVAASDDLFAAGKETVDPPVMPAGQTSKISLRINGETYVVLAEPRWTLLYCLRDVIGLTGAKPGCERGECGACTVLIDGVPRYACLTLAVEAQGSEVTTLEGLMDGETLGSVQTAFAEADAFQCGYCTPGQIMAVEGLLRANPNPSAEEIRRGASGNLCRCGAYQHIFEAAHRAAERTRGK
jgi:xanthine dehydrogenase YagT iron-sulfur-binding subunit